MARTSKANAKANTKAATNHKSSVNIVGILTDVYEGKNNNYITIKVDREDINPKTKEPYYDNIKVTASPDIELFDDGTTVEVVGTIRQYFDSNISRSTMYIVADSITEVSNG